MTLWHYTCDHGRDGIGDHGTLRPAREMIPRSRVHGLPSWYRPALDLVWLTDLPFPARDALGLTSLALSCDRTAHRYRCDSIGPVPYIEMRPSLPRKLSDCLESATGSGFRRWWVSSVAVPVVYDPIGSARMPARVAPPRLRERS